MTTLKEVKEKITADSYSSRGGVFTLRKEFFYRHGRTVENVFLNKIKEHFPAAKVLESGEVWKPFRGGASVANSSHWFVRFTFPK